MERIGLWFPIMSGLLLVMVVAAIVAGIVMKSDIAVYVPMAVLLGLLFWCSIKEQKGVER